MDSIKEILIKRDGISAAEADILIAEAAEELRQRIANDDTNGMTICQEYFGLEPDYIEELLPLI